MLQSGAVADFALDIFQFWGVEFANESPRLVEAGHVAAQTFRVECLVDFSQRGIGVPMPRLGPYFVFSRMAGQAFLFRREDPVFAFASPLFQRSEEKLLNLFIVRFI